MKKYKFDALGVEITRRCNLKCLHCCRGDAQDLTITPEIVDAIFENVEECPKWELTGGETLLAMEMLEYFIKALTHSNICAKSFSFTTNGSILNPDLVPLLAYFSESEEDRTAGIRLSDDKFHNIEQTKKAFEFYSRQASNYKRVEVNFIMGGELKKVQERDPFINYRVPIILSGRALDHVDVVTQISKDGIQPMQVKNHRIRIDDNTVKCYLQILANGNVCFMEMQDYYTMDRLSFGNVLRESISDIITKHNADCLLSCRDLQQWEKMSAWRIPGYLMQEYPMMPFLNELVSRIGESVFEKILAARKEAHKKYPHIPTWRIIEEIPFPDFQHYGIDTVKKILNQFVPFELSDVLCDIDVGIVDQAIEAMKNLENDPEKIELYRSTDSLIDALKCFGKLDEMKVSQSVIDALEPINSQYENESTEAEEKNSACQETVSEAIKSLNIMELAKFYYKSAFEHMYSKAGYDYFKGIKKWRTLIDSSRR